MVQQTLVRGSAAAGADGAGPAAEADPRVGGVLHVWVRVVVVVVMMVVLVLVVWVGICLPASSRVLGLRVLRLLAHGCWAVDVCRQQWCRY